MISTVAALAAMYIAIQSAMTNPGYAWSKGRSWAMAVSTSLTDAQLHTDQPACCDFLEQDGKILRAGNGTLVFLIKR